MKTVILEEVSKEFKIGYKKRESALKSFILLFSGRSSKKTINVLQKVSFSIEGGKVVGVVGENGSGKSTLLRVIAGIYPFDKGKLVTKGKIVSLINLGAGLKVRLTMRDNIYLLGSLFALRTNEIKRKLPEIVAFSGLKGLLDTQIYQFSEGMVQRLVFSLAVYSDPKILLLDEVFEIGDDDFKKKSSEKIKELVKNGTSVILVSHDISLIQKYCDKLIWVAGGKIKMYGFTNEVLSKYHNFLNKE